MSLLLFASAFVALNGSLHAPPTIKVDAANGDTISGERTFRVTVDSTDPINQVEFYVGSDLRDTETATPYLFAFDTLDEKDGDIKLRFKAYTVSNQTSERLLTLHVDNEIGKGAPYHIQKGSDALSDSKWQTAINQGRIALKIDPQSNPARLVLARANLGLNAFDKAQKYAEDAVAQDATDDTALQLLSAIYVREAFGTYAKEGSDRADVLNQIKDDFSNAVTTRRKSLDLEVDKAGPASGTNLIHWTDVVLRAERYSLAIETLAPVFRADPSNKAIGDRIVYAQIRAGRALDALKSLTIMRNASALDAYGSALLALAYIDQNDDQKADIAIKDAISSDPDDLGVRMVQAFIALKRNKTGVLSSIANDLGRDQGQRADVNYFLMALADRQQRYGDARRYFETAVLAEPAYPDVYIEQANYSIGLAQGPKLTDDEKKQNYENAKMYYNTALIARPEAEDALAGMAVVALFEKNLPDAMKFGIAARDAEPGNAAGHFVMAAIYEASRKFPEAQIELKTSWKLDKLDLEGRSIPTAVEAWKYLNTGGRVPVISTPPPPAAAGG